MRLLGHVLRKDELENVILTGYIEGRRDRGKQRGPFLSCLEKITDRNPGERIRLTRDRSIWTGLCNSSNQRSNRIQHPVMIMTQR